MGLLQELLWGLLGAAACRSVPHQGRKSAGKGAPWCGQCRNLTWHLWSGLGCCTPCESMGEVSCVWSLLGETLAVHKLSQRCLRPGSLWPAEGARPKAVNGWELAQLAAGQEDASCNLAGTRLSRRGWASSSPRCPLLLQRLLGSRPHGGPFAPWVCPAGDSLG